MLKDIVNNPQWTSSMPALINQFFEHGGQTIAELAKRLEVSVPYTTKTLNELIALGLVREIGKRDNYSKRAPKVYDLTPTSGYFLGVDIITGYIKVAICDFCGNLVGEAGKIRFEYQDDTESFDQLVEFINSYIAQSGIQKDQIQYGCMSIGGRVNPILGCAYTFFTCLEQPIAEALTEKLGIKMCIDNDSRCMTYGEYLKGVCKGLKNVIFVNASLGLGIGIVIDGKLYLGKSGFSGEIGHMHMYENGVICHCGKVGCMETETSGSAIIRKMQEQILEGKPSVLSDKVANLHQNLTLEDVFDAIEKEDVLAIGIVQKAAMELGNNLAGIINIFNPEMLVIGGDLCITGDYLTLPISMGIKKYSLNLVSKDSKFAVSTLKDKAGLIGACLMARSKMIDNNN